MLVGAEEVNKKIEELLNNRQSGLSYSSDMNHAGFVLEYMRDVSRVKQNIFWDCLYDTISIRNNHSCPPHKQIKTTRKLSVVEVLLYVTPMDICKAALLACNKPL